jgi:hypothetical protein
MGFLDFLKGVGEVFASLARLLPNFPKFVLCFVKLLVVVILNWLIMLPGVNYVITWLLNCVVYLLTVLAKTVAMLCLYLAVGLVAMIDMFGGASGKRKNGVPMGNNSLGVRLKGFVALFSTCLEDPRGWFTVQRWHMSNSVSSLFGVYPCMTPCFRGYEPMTESGGLLCTTAQVGTPEFCSAAAITRVAEQMGYRPLPGADLSHSNCSYVENSLSGNQKSLVDTVCTQPKEYDNGFLRAACFERYCANPSSDDTGPRLCADLVANRTRVVPVEQQLLFIPVLLIAGAHGFYTMVSSLKTKQNEYSALQ